MTRFSALLPIACVSAGILYVTYLLAQLPGEVFFSGDGGIKALLTKQALDGFLAPDLRLSAEPWVQDLWSQGHYPFDIPFIYESGGQHVPCFPVFFQWLTAPFYGLLGVSGLYLIPVAAGIAIWAAFYSLCRRLGASPILSAGGLLALQFASPLTLYCAMFWEHTLAAFLAFVGIAPTLLALRGLSSKRRLLLGGAALGFSGFLRPENVCLAGIVVTAWSLVAWRRQLRMEGLVFAISTTGMLLVFFIFNYVSYGHVLGANSYVVLKTKPFTDHLLTESIPLTWTTLATLLYFMPLAGVVLGLAACRCVGTGGRNRTLVVYLLAIVVGLLIAVPVMTVNAGGSGWGPRYLLSSVAIFHLIGVLMFEHDPDVLPTRRINGRSWSRVIIPASVIVSVAWAVKVNLGDGTKALAANYGHRVCPAIELLNTRPEKYVIISDQFVAQELTSEMRQRTFLRIAAIDDLGPVAESLQKHSVDRFLFFLAVYQPGRAIPRSLQGSRLNLLVDCRYLGQYGWNFFVYEGTVHAGMPD